MKDYLFIILFKECGCFVVNNREIEYIYIFFLICILKYFNFEYFINLLNEFDIIFKKNNIEIYNFFNYVVKYKV